MADLLIRFIVIVFLMALYRCLKHLWSVKMHFSGTDIDLDKTVPYKLMYLLNFSTEKNARRAFGLLDRFFPAVALEVLENGRWNVECKRDMKPRPTMFFLVNMVVKLTAFWSRGDIVFVGAKVS
ncbi:MAG: hypothetical protein V4484_17240 [Pseudomonadota bacterium]